MQHPSSKIKTSTYSAATNNKYRIMAMNQCSHINRSTKFVFSNSVCEGKNAQSL